MQGTDIKRLGLLPDRLLTHVRTPLYRNAYAWMLSTGISSGLGIVYWLLAARLYPSEIVGHNVALVSGMMFLSGVSQLNLMSAMVRFLPQAGVATHRLVLWGYGISVAAAALLGGGLWLALHFVGAVPLLAIDMEMLPWFVISMMAWSIFALQDSVLTGLRDAVWVPIENSLYAIIKIGLLIWFAQLLPTYGIFAAWVLPIFFAIIPINWLIFRRIIPRHVAAVTAQNSNALDLRSMLRFISGNYLGSLFTLASARLLPVLVTWRAGGTAGAYFYMAWTIANALKLVTTQMTLSLTVEGAHEQATIDQNGRRFLRSLLLIFGPAVLVTILAAPWILRLSGAAYAVEGKLVLQLMALSVLPGMVTLLYLGIARARDQIRGIILAQGTFCLLLLGLSYWLLPRQGIVGVGVAMLVSEAVVATVLLVTQLWPTWRQRRLPVHGTVS